MKILNKARVALLALGLVVAGGMLVPVGSASAIRCIDGSDRATISDCPEYGGTDAKKKSDLNAMAGTIINVVLGVIGFVAVLMIIYGGFLYTTSAGDSSKVTKAKNTIMYGIVGLVIALLAFAIVNFVLKSLFQGGSSGGGI